MFVGPLPVINEAVRTHSLSALAKEFLRHLHLDQAQECLLSSAIEHQHPVLVFLFLVLLAVFFSH